MANVVGGSVVWNLDVDASKLNTGLKNAADQVKGIKGSFEDAQRGSEVFAAGIAALGAATIAFGVLSVKAYSQQEDAIAGLNAGLKNTGENVALASAALQKQATSLQQVTKFSDESILSADAMLTTFKLQGKTIESLNPVLLDMAEGLRDVNGNTIGLDEGAKLMGKAMGNAAGGVDGLATALRRNGVIMTDAQKAIFSTGTEAQRTATLVQIMGDNFGGRSLAAGQTFSGQMTIMKNNINDFEEAIGKVIVTGLEPMIVSFNKWFIAIGGPNELMKKLADTVKNIIPNLPIIVGLIAGGLAPALYAAAAGMWALMSPLIPFMIAGAALGLLIKVLNDHFDLLGKGFPILAGLLTTFAVMVGAVVVPAFMGWAAGAGAAAIATIAATWPLLLIALAVGVVVAAIVWLATNWRTVWDGLLVVAVAVYDGINNVIENVKIGFGSIVTFLADVWKKITTSAVNAWNSIGAAISQSIQNAHNNITNIVNGIWNFLVGTWNNIRSFFANMAGSIVSAIVQPFNDARSAIERIANEIRNAANNINPFVRHSPSLVDNVIAGIKIIKDQYLSLGDISLPPITQTLGRPNFAMDAPMNILGRSSIGGNSGAPSGSNTPVNIYVDHVNDMQDVSALGREMGFRLAITK